MKKYKDKTWLYQRYWVDELSTHQIAAKYEYTSSVVEKWMRKLNVPRRTNSESLKLYFKKHPNANKGKNSSRWKGGKFITEQGYVLILTPNHPRTAHRGYVAEHRLVIEKHLGRYLTKGEIVHHINGIKDDNRIENLLLMNRKEHRKNYVDGYRTGFAAALVLFATINKKENQGGLF